MRQFWEPLRRKIAALIQGGDAETAILHAQRILLVDPSADAIELQLLRAYKRGGRHAAAAEQYAHYASMFATNLVRSRHLLLKSSPA